MQSCHASVCGSCNARTQRTLTYVVTWLDVVWLYAHNLLLATDCQPELVVLLSTPAIGLQLQKRQQSPRIQQLHCARCLCSAAHAVEGFQGARATDSPCPKSSAATATAQAAQLFRCRLSEHAVVTKAALKASASN